MPLSLRERALRYLAQRDHSRAELIRKLASHGEEEEISQVLARLDELGLLSDTRFAESFVRSRANRLGNGRLRQDLARKGVDRDTIELALAGEHCQGSELERAWEIRARKFGEPPTNGREWARQARFLQGRGFATDIIRKVLKDWNDEPA
ncbi:MAG: recombination regulator RecX [Rhodocyclaceae bacterium]|jgi:regulatory protein|nr:recombination regulator RecX [Rhodocyclaceae bacterium]